MNTEQPEPTVHYGDDGHSASPVTSESADGSPATAGNGSSNSRRRRRRRKGKGPNPNQPQSQNQNQPVAAQADGEAVSFELLPVVTQAQVQGGGAAAPAQNGSQNNSQNGYAQGGKRKNGRKRSGGSGGGGNPQPGNGQPRQQRQARQNTGGGGAWRRGGSGEGGPDGNREGARGGFGGSEHFQDANGNAGGRRKGKFGKRGPTSFVGPMDHSYRMVNGNVADGPPSTMDYRNANGNANGNMSGRNEYSEVEQTPTVRENAPVRIVCFIEDLFIVTKMNETARKMGVKLQFAKAEKETLATITDGPEAERPALIIFDLNNVNAKPLTLIPKLKAKLKRGTSIIGFLQHVQGDLKMKAVEAGCDTVLPRSAFSLSLPNLLRRYGFDEAEELAEA
jgi:hypothetical protein